MIFLKTRGKWVCHGTPEEKKRLREGIQKAEARYQAHIERLRTDPDYALAEVDRIKEVERKRWQQEAEKSHLRMLAQYAPDLGPIGCAA
jgi:hypothetical protein